MGRRIVLIDIGQGLSLAGVLPSAVLYAEYAARVTARGGVAPYTYSLDAGAAELAAAGFELDSATGYLRSSSVAAPGRFPLTVRATDITGAFVTRQYEIAVVDETLPMIVPEAASLYAKLVSWWPLDVGLGDVHGGNPLQGTYGAIPGVVGNALSPAGPVGSNSATGVSFTRANGGAIGVWQKPVTANYAITSSLGQGGAAGEVLYVSWALNSARRFRAAARFGTSAAVDAISGSQFDIDSWHLAIAQVLGNSLELWVDGNLEASTPITTPSEPSLASRFEIGARYSSTAPNGAVDEMFYANSPLSVEEIAYVWNNGIGRSYDELKSASGH